MLLKYRYTGEAEALIPDLHRIIRPGEVIETDQALNNPNLELVAEKAPAKTPKAERGE